MLHKQAKYIRLRDNNALVLKIYVLIGTIIFYVQLKLN